MTLDAVAAPPTWDRDIALDVHQHSRMIGGIAAQQRIVRPPRTLDLERWLAWAHQHLRPTDAVVIEATTNAGTSLTNASRWLAA